MKTPEENGTIPRTSSQRPKDTYFLTESVVIHLQRNISVVYFPGGGERKGREGIVVGIGMDGIVVGIGMVGIEGMLGSGGKVTLGRLGIVGRLGSGGSEGLGREGCVVGNVGCGSVGIEGIGGNVGLGSLETGLLAHLLLHLPLKTVPTLPFLLLLL
ncbi:hypothetical protein DKX38_026636 [Salix brachista]|uniref:Uncharacterized protein n=1 Tax=Salix brachista TaxID=2182728 RepID=A0A5N5JA06_9ROSI|nr:hypothetical protein DKX38_026636 [Salix brachista]